MRWSGERWRTAGEVGAGGAATDSAPVECGLTAVGSN